MNLKQEAARQALSFVKDGMVLGLGSGSTSAIFVDLLGEQVQSGSIKGIVGIPTSEDTARRASSFGIPLARLVDCCDSTGVPALDLAVDGADEVDPGLNLIKGLGKALLREKIVEIHARKFVVIVDESNIVTRLGRGPLPVEIVPFEAAVHVNWLNTLGCRAERWLEEDGSPVVTDNGNYLARCWFENGIPDPQSLGRALADRPGIVEHGLFLDMADLVIVAGANGVRVQERQP
jgi:ribose 5-phosphate isomerase A